MTEYDSLSTIMIQEYQNIVNSAKKNEVRGISTGFERIDEITNGLHPGSLMTIGGATGIGKTSFVLNVLIRISIDANIPSLLFSVEMNSSYIANRILAIYSKLPIYKILGGQLNTDERKVLDESVKSLNGHHLYMENTHILYVEDVRRVATSAVAEKGVKVIVIDCLHMMYYKQKMNENRYTEINSIICQLKSIAMELQVTIIVTSQINRNIDSRDNRGLYAEMKTPVLSDLRDSGTIGEDSDVVIFLHRPEFYHYYEDNGQDLRGIAKIIVAKNRYGPIKETQLRFDKDCLVFDEKTGLSNNGDIFDSFSPEDYAITPRGLEDMPY